MKVKFDGYSFGDRILDGVNFQCDIDDNNVVSNVVVDPESDGGYWESLNKPKFLKLAKEYVENNLKNNKEEFLGDLATII